MHGGETHWCHTCRSRRSAAFHVDSGEYECSICNSTFVEGMRDEELLAATTAASQIGRSDTAHLGPERQSSLQFGPNSFMHQPARGVTRIGGGVDVGSQGDDPYTALASRLVSQLRVPYGDPSVLGSIPNAARSAGPLLSSSQGEAAAAAGEGPSPFVTAASGLAAPFPLGPLLLPSTRIMRGPQMGLGGGQAAAAASLDGATTGGPEVLDMLVRMMEPLLAPGGGLEGGTGVAAQMGDFVLGDMTSVLEQLLRHDTNTFGAAPASQAAIDSLETVVVNTEDEETSREGCPVCQDAFVRGGEALKRMPCDSSHVFHEHCIVTWLKQHNSCPVCRSSLPEPGLQSAAAPDT